MWQGFLAGEPVLGIEHEELLDQIDAVGGYLLKFSMLEVIVKRDDLLEDDCLVVTLEG